MPKDIHPLKLPNSIKAAATRLAKTDGVSLDPFISVAVAEKIGSLETADQLLRQRAGKANPAGLLQFLSKAPNVKSSSGETS